MRCGLLMCYLQVTVTAKALVYAPSQLYAVAINCRGKVSA